MFGGPPRMYQAIDMGPAAVLEVLILPRGTSVKTDISTLQQSSDAGGMSSSTISNQNMILTGGPSTMWTTQNMFTHYQPLVDGAAIQNADSAVATTTASAAAASTLYGRQRNEAFRSNFQSTVGGLQPQIDSIVRRVLDGRVIRPADNDNSNINGQMINGGGDVDDDLKTQEKNLNMASLEAQELELLGLTPVRGLLLYGPPGCGELWSWSQSRMVSVIFLLAILSHTHILFHPLGKTALAREISRTLRARTPRIISAPELLDRWASFSCR